MENKVNIVAVVVTIAAVVAAAFLLSEGNWLGPLVALAACLVALFAALRGSNYRR